MKKSITRIMAALALLVTLAIPMGMRGQTTVSYGWETSDNATEWTITDAIVATTGEGNTGTYAGKINTNHTYVQFNEKVYVTSFSFAFKRTSNNNNYNVYIETSTDGNTWTAVETYAMSSFSNGSYTTKTHTFDGTTEYYVRFHCYNTTAIRYVDDVTITYNSSAAQLDPCDLTLTNASTSLVFDLYNNSDTQVINYTTSSTGEVTVEDSDYITTEVDQTNKTITVTPVAVTNGAKVITVNQAADDNYAAGSKTFTINITDSTPFTGGDVTFDATVDKDLENTAQGEGSITKFGVTFACNNGILGNGSEYRMYKNSVTTFSVSEGTITQIAFTGTSGNPASGFATQTGWTTDGYNGTWTGSAQEVSFTASGAQVRATLIVVTVDLGGAPAPSITANNVEITYDTDADEIEYEINNAVDGGVLTAGTESDWLTLGEVGATVPFTCSVNEAGSERTATVTLTYTYNRATVTKDVTVTQAGNPNVTMTIAEVREQGTDNVVTIGTVTSFSENNNNTTAYIQDASAAIVVYGNFTTSVGDEIRVSGTLSTYHGLLEITNPEVTVISQGNTVNPEVMTIADINASTNQGWYIRIENATVTEINDQNTTIAQGENTIVVRGISGVEYDVNDVISLNGNIGCFDGNQIANPQNVEVQAAPAVPSITFNPDVVELTAEQQTIQIPFTHENIVVTGYQSFTVHHYDAEGEEIQSNPETPWFIAGIVGSNDEGYNLTVYVSANEGEARSAYMKVSALDAEENVVYSNLITINQAQYVVDYATLPFEWSSFGTNPAGITNNGVSTGNNNDYLKFDGSGDYIILKFNERPGTLTFDVKGNPGQNGWAGTFKVQTSVNGETFIDLATYEELPTNDYQSESFATLDENVRYIKWIYETKTSGNVAVDNIVLNNYTGPVATITVNPTSIDIPAEGGEGTITVTYSNFTEINADIDICDAEGNPATYDWITVGLNSDNNVDYLVDANDGEMRTAYFRVYAYNDFDEVYSDFIAVNQVAVVIPPTGAQYALYTGGLIEGDYLIVYDGGAMNTTVENDRLQFETVAITNDVIVTDNAEIVWHIAPSGEYWTIYNADAEAYAASTGAKNKAQMLADGTDDKALWTVSGTETYDFVNKNNAANSVNANLRKNGTYGFACYSTSTGGALSLYKKVDLPANSIVIEGYGDSERGGYYLIASPFTVSPTDVQGMTEGEYDLYSFDEAEEDEWRNYKAGVFENLEPGKGYLYAHSTDVTLTFDGEAYNGDPIVLKKTAGCDFEGWNLVGNPYTGKAYIDRDFYVMNPQTGDEIITGEGNEIAAMQGFFVIADHDGEELEISTEPTEEGGKIVMNVNSNRGNIIDRAMIRFGEGRQLPKFMLNEDNTKLYIAKGEEEYAVARNEAKGEMNLNFEAAKDGTYTLDFTVENVELDQLLLIDNKTGVSIDLLNNPSYTFEANTTDNAARFCIVFGITTTVSEENANTFAFYNNGNLILNNEGAAILNVVDVLGRVISSYNINGSESIHINAQAGVYMLQLVQGDKVSTQKIVIE